MAAMGETEHQAQTAISGLEYAMKWATLPPEHLKLALASLEPQLIREHEYRMASHTLEMAKLQRNHLRMVVGQGLGFLVALGMVGGAIYLGTHEQPWLAFALVGPTLLLLAALFVTGRSDSSQIKVAMKATEAAMAAASPPPAL